jgi:hypothetical protein
MLTLSYVLAQQERYEDLLREAERERTFQQALKVGSASRTRVLSRALLSLERWLRPLPLVTSGQHRTHRHFRLRH